VHLSADEQGNHVWISGYISGYTNSSDQEVYLYSTALKQRLLTIGPFGPNGVLRAEFLTDGRFVLLVNRETAGLIGLDAAEPDITLPETEWEMGTEFVLRSYRLPSSTDMLQRARSHSPI